MFHDSTQSEVTLLTEATKLDLIMVFKLGFVIMITLASCAVRIKSFRSAKMITILPENIYYL